MLLNYLVWIMSLPLLNRIVIESHTRTAREGDKKMVQR